MIWAIALSLEDFVPLLDAFPQADEKVVRREVAAGLPRHISDVFSAGWRRNAASASLFHQPARDLARVRCFYSGRAHLGYPT